MCGVTQLQFCLFSSAFTAWTSLLKKTSKSLSDSTLEVLTCVSVSKRMSSPSAFMMLVTCCRFVIPFSPFRPRMLRVTTFNGMPYGSLKPLPLALVIFLGWELLP